MRYAIWLDDERDPKDHGFTYRDDEVRVLWVKTVPDFKQAFLDVTNSEGDILHAISFDNDLGRLDGEGRDAFNWMEDLVRTRGLPKFRIYAHTMNTAAKQSMRLGILSLRDYWMGITSDQE